MNDLDPMFAEVEKRVCNLVQENKALQLRVAELERELEAVRREANELRHFEGKRLHIREKIEKILGMLDGAVERRG